MAYEYTGHLNGLPNPKNFTRGNPIPLDSWSLFMSYSSANTYAKENGVAYPGQVLTVLENNGATVYYIGPGRSYTQTEKTRDAAWYADESANKATFWATYYANYAWTPKKPSGTAIGDDYTQEEKDLDDAWYADESANHLTFITSHPELGGFTPLAASDAEVGIELTGTRSLVQLGTKDDINAASASAVMNWLGADGNAIAE